MAEAPKVCSERRRIPIVTLAPNGGLSQRAEYRTYSASIETFGVTVLLIDCVTGRFCGGLRCEVAGWHCASRDKAFIQGRDTPCVMGLLALLSSQSPSPTRAGSAVSLTWTTLGQDPG